MLKCRPRITYAYGCRESYQAGGFFFYFCPRGFSFVAGSICNLYGDLMGGIVAGPFLIQEEKGTPLLLIEMNTGMPGDPEMNRLPVVDKYKTKAMERIIMHICNALSEKGYIFSTYGRERLAQDSSETQLERTSEELELEGRLHESDMTFKIKQYVRSHYREKITLQSLADHVFLSPAYLSSMFKQETGDSLFGYINRVRVEASKPLLAETDRTILDVAQECGFSDQSYFTKVFRDLAGVSPGKYRIMIKR